jgi:dinuclear metal center YbgI/SA1388 family protein
MLLKEIQSILQNKLIPKKFKLNSEIYGLQYYQNRPNKLIKRIMLTIDLTIDALHYAVKNKVNLIISHHGLIRSPIETFNQNIINKLTLLTKYPISIFVLNSAFIAAEGGVSETIANAIYLNIENTFCIRNNTRTKVPIGRICTPKHYVDNAKEMKLEDLLKRIRVNLNLTHVFYVGDLHKIIKMICIVGGDTPNGEYLKKALDLGCDCYITGKINHFDAIYGRDLKLTIIETSHYKNEILALKKLCNTLSLEFPYIEFSVFESGDPFKIYL